MSIRSFSLVLAGFSAVFGQNATSLPSSDAKVPFQLDGPAQTYPIGQVFCQGVQYDFVDFGKRSLAYGSDIQAAPVWIMVSGFDLQGRPLLIEGQRVIFDHIPSDQEYSDLKRVNYVVVPSNYSINSHTDARSVRGNFTETSPAGRVFVNYPVVTYNSKVERGMVRLSKGWYQGLEVHYFDMGLTFGNTAIAYQPQDSDGNPSGLPVTSTAPGQSGYTAFWKLFPITQTSDSYDASAVNSVETLLAAINRTDPPTTYSIVNHPLLPLNSTPMDNSTIDNKDSSSLMEGKASDASHPKLSIIILTTLAMILAL